MNINGDDDKKNDLYYSHPSKEIKSTLGNSLSDKKIILCITASVACYKSIDLIRLLMRHGAEVFVVMSKTVEKFISKDYFVWASGNKVVSELTGDLEHILLADYGKSDLVVVYPSTANTIGKFANGIDDTPTTSVLSVALGAKIPIVIAPAMHKSMYKNDIIKENIAKLEKNNVMFINPKIEEGKAKIANIEVVLSLVIKILKQSRFSSNNDLKSVEKSIEMISFIKKSEKTIYAIKDNDLKIFFRDKRILISLGSTVEYIDPIRIISNTSSGKMGVSLAKRALQLESVITIVKGFTHCHEKILNEQFDYPTSNFKEINVTTSQQMRDVIIKELNSNTYDLVILAAAVSDFKPCDFSSVKINSNLSSLTLTLFPTAKIVNEIKDVCRDLFLVAFKADYNVPVDILLQKSYKKMVEAEADLVVANDVGKKDTYIGSDLNEVFILDKNKYYYHFPIQNKYEVASNIFKSIYLYMGTS
jgi:phosphopantothenoylcysteine decarboxylase/phosphopantothenate--cysteine ligase